MANVPLAERMRPQKLEEIFGQKHLLDESAVLYKAIKTGKIPSMILWGPPGVGKTTIARVIANESDRIFIPLSAINSGVKDLREAIARAKKQKFFDRPNPILFIDEIHRFSKSQQDALLGAVENGTVTLVGATTENPSFEVISALLSRCQVYVLKHLDRETLIELINKSVKTDYELKERAFKIESYDAMLQLSGGDARKLMNILELVVNQSDGPVVITDQAVMDVVQENIAIYDKGGEQHFDIISAFIKSIRGSDPNAAVYWLARMIEGGEDIKFIARRLLILASEDIGLANPNAILVANSIVQGIQFIGMPEGRILLSQLTIFLATSPKSNSAYMAIRAAQSKVKETGPLPVPLHIRNAPTQLMKDMAYGKGYQYSHDYTGNFSDQEFLPEDISGANFYIPGSNKYEEGLKNRLEAWWQQKYKFEKPKDS